ncbi:DNA-directed RNA polymerase III subunit RPC3 [Bombardia bombarda]|uniref:DNA-directed RNA polymerase III subunit RPC3 n=1 Tax=Bombardia bombarda TaxID=252184 RepID=A0AA39TQ07_9PEZI|nr:DNA-directed RNA polymerase III subunit RPC3 [Bombardia bombarda]
MNRTQLRHGLAILIQHNLLYYDVDSDTHMAYYEANTDNAYCLIRTGKILEMIDTSFGPPTKDVVQSLLLLGQTRISDLVAAYREKIASANQAVIDKESNVFDDAAATNGNSQPKKLNNLAVKSTAQLNSILCRLVEAELIDVVHDKSFQSPIDTYKAVEKEATDTFFPGGVKGGKAKIEFEEKIAEGLRKVRNESKLLKRKLEQNGPAAKRRKLFLNGGVANGAHDEEEDKDPALDPKQVIRINYEKCLVELRNRRLVQFASEMIGDMTSYVYGVLLKQLTKQLSRCRLDPAMDMGELEEGQGSGIVTTAEILDSLKTSVDLSLGLGKTSREALSSRAAEKLQELPPKKKLILEADVDGDARADESEDDGSDSDESGTDDDAKDYAPPAANGSKVKFADSTAKEQKMDRPTQLRQHLLLLAESSRHFVRHCGYNEWTVDFVPLMQVLREAELDSVIERTSGRQGLRLVRILRNKGKLDEKALPNVALMRKPEIQQKMLEMQTAGFVQVQEVPRDNKADVKKSFFLWFHDEEKSIGRLLDTSYKAMLRCMQVLEVVRQKERDVLMLTKRTDVKGREEEVMRKEYYERYRKFLDCERKLFAQTMRLDDMVALLRDY